MGEVRRRSPCRPAGQTPIWSCWWQAPRQLQQTLRLITLQPNLAHSEKQFFKEKSFTFLSVIRNFSSTNTTVITSNQEKTNFFPKKIPQPPPHTMNYGLFCKANYSNVK